MLACATLAAAGLPAPAQATYDSGCSAKVWQYCSANWQAIGYGFHGPKTVTGSSMRGTAAISPQSVGSELALSASGSLSGSRGTEPRPSDPTMPFTRRPPARNRSSVGAGTWCETRQGE